MIFFAPIHLLNLLAEKMGLDHRVSWKIAKGVPFRLFESVDFRTFYEYSEPNGGRLFRFHS
jgi:hypothetical protein